MNLNLIIFLAVIFGTLGFTIWLQRRWNREEEEYD